VISKAVGYGRNRNRSHDAVIRVYDAAGNVIETHDHQRRVQWVVEQRTHWRICSRLLGWELCCCSCIATSCSATRSFSADHMMRRSEFDTNPHPINVPPHPIERLFDW